MAADDRAEAGTVARVLADLRRATQRVRRDSPDVIESAVSQLFDAAVRHPVATDSGEYRIDELARRSGTTTRNIRVYRDRGLLPPPRRVGRVALYDDTHLTRLRLITSMLDRGYTIAHVKEMLTAWQSGKDLADVLGLETAIAGSWTTERPETMPRARVTELVGGRSGFDRLAELGLVRVDGIDATVTRPKLLETFSEIHSYGIPMDTLFDLYAQTLPHIDAISDMLVRAGAAHVVEHIKPGEPLPADTEIAALVTMLVRFRTQAVASVTATLASSIESTIETMVGKLLSDYLANAAAEAN